MRCLLAASLLGCVLATGCAGSVEDQVKGCALAYVAAGKAKDLDRATGLAAVPFLILVKTAKGYDVDLVETPDGLRAKLKAVMGAPEGHLDRLDVLELVPAAGVTGKLGPGLGPEASAAVERVLGPDGFAVILGRDGTRVGGLFVARRGGKTAVVGVFP